MGHCRSIARSAPKQPYGSSIASHAVRPFKARLAYSSARRRDHFTPFVNDKLFGENAKILVEEAGCDGFSFRCQQVTSAPFLDLN